MAAEIKAAFGVEPRLIPSKGGCFEVEADGQQVFSKLALGRFPESGELIKLLQPLAGA